MCANMVQRCQEKTDKVPIHYPMGSLLFSIFILEHSKNEHKTLNFCFSNTHSFKFGLIGVTIAICATSFLKYSRNFI